MVIPKITPKITMLDNETALLYTMEYCDQLYTVLLLICQITNTSVGIRLYQPSLFYIDMVYRELDIVPEYIQYQENLYYFPYIIDKAKAQYFFGIQFK